MGKVYLKIPKVEELEYRQYLLSKREEMTDFPSSIWETWANRWLSNDKNYFYAYVNRKKDGLNVGEVYYYFDTEEQMPMIYVFIESLYRRNYYGQEAICLLLNRCLNKQKFDVVGVKFAKNNVVLNKFFAKLGFKLYKETNDFLYGKITKEDYQIREYIDDLGKIKKLPTSLKLKYRLIEYMSSKFVFGQLYSDRAILKIISDNANKKDIDYIKSQLLSLGYLSESTDKSKYERIK